jgi:signal transduction histidine kinase
VFDRGELLGALSLTKPEGERPSQTEESLARTLASEAGLVLRNVRLTEELLHRMEELRASRQRIVTAQDAERRRLERDLHDGAQQQLVALAVKAGLARTMLERDPGAVGRLLEELRVGAQEANQTLRDLARGIFPAILVDEGLAAAIRSQASKSAVPLDVRAGGIGRYPPELEAAVYFCVLEALQNVAKSSQASRACVDLEEAGGALRFRVVDDGIGFDRSTAATGMGLQNMEDRLAALGGELEIRSRPGEGTEVAGSLPLGR